LIGPGGLLLVLSDQCAVPVLVLWVELEKGKKKTKLECEEYFGKGHTLSTDPDSLLLQGTTYLWFVQPGGPLYRVYSSSKDAEMEYIYCMIVK
jgi:hypothetical protein